MTNKELAEQIIAGIGGQKNIISIDHCATRLRIMIKDKEKIDTEKIENLDRVAGAFFNAGQYQVILGTGLVDKIHDEALKILGDNAQTSTDVVKKEGTSFQRAIRIFGDVFVPIVPVLVATGLFMGLRGLLTQEAFLNLFGLTPASIPSHLLLFTQVLTDTAFVFLPALVCWSTFKIFGGNPVLGIVIGLMLVNPALPNAYEVGSGAVEPLKFFGFINVVGYQASVLPAFIVGIIGSRVEKWLKTKIPDALDLLLTPFLTLLSSIVLGLFVVGPIFHGIELGLLHVVQFLLDLPFGIGGLFYGSFGQLLGIFGVHHILNFLEINMLANTGWNMLNPIGTCGNMAQAGAVLAVAIKTVDVKMKQIAYPSALSATLGITEPAVFGVNLRLVKPFVMAMIGGGIGGFLASILQLKATGMGVTGIPGTLLYLNDQLPLYIIVNLVSFGVAFGLTWVFGYRNEEIKLAAETSIELEQVENSKVNNSGITVPVLTNTFNMPVDGKVIPITEIKDPTFSRKFLGDGIGVVPFSNIIYSPVVGMITSVFPTKHAIGIKTIDGEEILLHIGIDTVELNGEGFEVFIKEGAKVDQNTPLVKIDFDVLNREGKDSTIILVFPNQKTLNLNVSYTDTFERGDFLFELK
ncbi:sucrose-specific PTS transporter subunit IIBC [Leuconostoc gelidum subsp. gelidum]|uniref:sucrose-specific PTS transporter subunit IIBC n=1 Tax=Leuconostoc gelidum TaxID=1244 RepID=UPI001CC50DA6|nr:sucrose-specific PTS transporter subunit IIBC [Leuconostoc gelidum]MBZ6013632.1 sucrose-specific PTS transporter subunit IIBC [Leuconostoc gelidum subsp. gelidum]